MTETKHIETVALACRDSSGSPCVVPVAVEFTERERALGLHYDQAEEHAKEEGYEGPFVAFDSQEIPVLIAQVDNVVAAASRQVEVPTVHAAVVTHDHRNNGMAEALMIFSDQTPVTDDALQLSAPETFEAHREDEDLRCDSLPADLDAMLDLMVRRAALGHEPSRASLDRLLSSGQANHLVSPEAAFEALWSQADTEDRLIVSGEVALDVGEYQFDVSNARAVVLNRGWRYAMEVPRDDASGTVFEYLMVPAEECEFEAREAA